MKSKFYFESFWLIVRIFIGIVFVYSGWTKVTAPLENFRGVIAQYEVIPYFFVPVIAAVLPWLELIFGFFLLTGYMTRFSALVTSGLCLSFVTLLGVYFFKTGKFPADCGCFGEGSLIHLSGKQVLMMDSANALLSLRLFFAKKHPWTLDAFFSKR
ncbi:MAG: DoxX family membrane protein [Candidatus Omnitrophica bacterium]|nr:DoxX family membrane protein [Candidatus Omnitrophota bacterium]